MTWSTGERGFNPLPRYARVSAIEAEFGLSGSTIRRLFDSGYIDGFRVGGQRHIERASVWALCHGEGGITVRRQVRDHAATAMQLHREKVQRWETDFRRRTRVVTASE